MTLIQPQPIPDLDGVGNVHFIAIGGAGMSGVASCFLARGIHVSGSDQSDSPTLAALAQQGAQVHVGHDASLVAGADAVVVSSAIRPDNVELCEARRLGVPVWHRSVALAAVMTGREVVAVAGTHGKTTTTAMCVAGLQGAGEDPSYVIGGTVLDTGLGAHIGHDGPFVVEADESDGSFRQYPARIGVITGIEADHLDTWGTSDAYRDGFRAFATGAAMDCVVLDGDDPGAAELARELRDAGRTVMTYGQSHDCDVVLSQVEETETANQARISYGSWSGLVTLTVPGVHNLHNAAAAVCVGLRLGLDPERFLAGLAGFHGTARRFQRLGTVADVTVVDDYAHHPTEVEATIAAARVVAGTGRVVVCFQPHLFSRTLTFADAFGAALAQADEVMVLDVYPAREDPIEGVTGELVSRAVEAHGGRVTYIPDMADAVSVILDHVKPGDLVLTVGAGSVTTLGPQILAGLEK
ncbi:MAG: UDP-N-acetylmuramate--L-alanine ligase [Propionibacteriaceae bacterium]|nr:UDP-N-acetylmuramate--L-alanine ligase [Propionibacteriaceae bacterium]